MEAAEKMAALKRAYAEIILNTAKEAAARVMVSERKALRLQQDLCSAKEEALRLLLRMKQMIDSKIKEAEETSLKQQKMIDELEAQLQEAEGIIVDLREELKLVTDELEKVKSNQMQNLKNGGSNDVMSFPKNMTEGGRSVKTMDPIVPYPSDSETANSDTDTPVNDEYRDHKSCSITEQAEPVDAADLEKLNAQDSNIASIVPISKERELCGNGCTQRFFAFEGKLKSRPLVVPGNVAHQNSEDKVMEIVKKKRRRKTRLGRTKSSSHRFQPSLHMNSLCRTAAISNGTTYSVKGSLESNEDGHDVSGPKIGEFPTGKGPLEMHEGLLQKGISIQDEVQIAPRGKRKRNARSRTGVFNSFSSSKSSVLSPCITYSVSNSSKCGEEKSNVSENGSEKQLLSDTDPEMTSKNSHEDSGSENVDKSTKLLDKETKVSDVFVLVKQSDDSADSTEHHSSGLSPNTNDVKVMNNAINHPSTFEEAKVSPTQADKNRLLKFTFHRKRKREPASNPTENTATEPGVVKRRVTEAEKDASELKNSNLSKESPRDSRRLAQVARQLIALSSSRWQ